MRTTSYQQEEVFMWVESLFPREKKTNNCNGRNIKNLLISSFILDGINFEDAVKKAESTFNF